MREEPILIPLAEVAKRAGRHPATLRKLLIEGKLEAFKIGRDWLFTPAQADQVPLSRGKKR